jgi:hypothetical protein
MGQMGTMFEALESRQLLSAVVGGGVEDAPVVPSIIFPAMPRGRAVFVDVRRQELRELIRSRRTAVRELVGSIREAKGDAVARAALKTQLADLKAQYKADIAAARTQLKERNEPIPFAERVDCPPG